MGELVLAVVVSLLLGGLGGYLMGRRRGHRQGRDAGHAETARHIGPAAQKAAADAIVDFLQRVNEFRPGEANAVRGLAWEQYPEARDYIMGQLQQHPYRPR
ncbi:hypothetical protein [Actinoplanes sp. NPDC026670]|uniref:hypothetical protein n=1 Tax=Actinoplanes sp. NPDC026670 TaxID=3154700 RepID=UPI00340DF1E5